MIYSWGDTAYYHITRCAQLYADPFAYELSCLYLSQAMRRGGWFAHYHDGFAALSKDYCGIGCHAIVSVCADSIPDVVKKALRESSALGIKVKYVKHVCLHDAEKLLATRQFTKLQRESGTEWLDDLSEDNYPQVILDLDTSTWTDEIILGLELQLPASPALSDFRSQIRRWGRRMVRDGNEKFVVQDLRQTSFLECERMLSDWSLVVEKRFLERGWPKVRDAKKCLYEPNLAVFLAAYSHKFTTCGEVFLIDGIPRGAWVGEQLSTKCLGIYSLIADTSIFNLSYFVLLRSLMFARSEGLSHVTLGGSESESLFRFKSISNSGYEGFCQERKVYDLATNATRGIEDF